VDDVLEFANLAAFPSTGESGKIYVAKDSNKTYRWSGSTYIEITSGGDAPSLTTITGSFNVTGLSQDEQVEVSVDHPIDAVFSFCEYPVITDAPEGVIVTVLARGYSNDSTNAQQFVLLWKMARRGFRATMRTAISRSIGRGKDIYER
jgi:hypothetical protein